MLCLKFFRELRDLFGQDSQFDGLLFQPVQVCRCLSLGKAAVQHLDNLVVIYPDCPELAVKRSQAHVVVHRRLVDLDGLYAFLENAGGDKMRHGVHARCFEKGQEARIFSRSKADGIAVDGGVNFWRPPSFVRVPVFFASHIFQFFTVQSQGILFSVTAGSWAPQGSHWLIVSLSFFSMETSAQVDSR